MISISTARKLTGTLLKKRTDEEITDLLNQIYGLAEITLDQVFLQGSNKTHRVIDLVQKKGQNGHERN